MSFEINEYCDMYKIYGECHGISRHAAIEYAVRFPLRRHPSDKVFTRLDQRIRETGQVVPPPNINAGRDRHVRTVDNEEQILDVVDEEPTLSTRQIARTMDLSHMSVHRVIKDEKLKPFHFTLVQKLEPEDYPRRVEFCQWLLRQNEADENFLSKIVWTDESLFTREGVFNRHNSHFYSEVNPYLTRDRGFQHRWRLNVWAGICGDQILGPCLFDHYLRVRET